MEIDHTIVKKERGRSAMTIEAAASLDSFFEVKKRAGARAYDSCRRARKKLNDYRGGGLFGQLFRNEKQKLAVEPTIVGEERG
jgi:hypothetical protein